jgi:transketolase N-terminal domain/subunit
MPDIPVPQKHPLVRVKDLGSIKNVITREYLSELESYSRRHIGHNMSLPAEIVMALAYMAQMEWDESDRQYSTHRMF